MVEFNVTHQGKSVQFIAKDLGNGDYLIDIDQTKNEFLKDLVVHHNAKDGTVSILRTVENAETPQPAPAPDKPAEKADKPTSEASGQMTKNLKKAGNLQGKGNFLQRHLWTPEKEQRSDLTKEIRAYNNNEVARADAALRGSNGAVTGTVLQDIMLTRGAFMTEENPVIPVAGTEETTRRQCPALPFCRNNKPTVDSLLRVSHWTQVLENLGLSKYADNASVIPKDAYYGLGKSFDQFAKDLVAAVKTDLKASDPSLDITKMTDLELLQAAGLKASMA